jgi:hypothetical protein
MVLSNVFGVPENCLISQVEADKQCSITGRKSQSMSCTSSITSLSAEIPRTRSTSRKQNVKNIIEPLASVLCKTFWACSVSAMMRDLMGLSVIRGGHSWMRNVESVHIVGR